MHCINNQNRTFQHLLASMTERSSSDLTLIAVLHELHKKAKHAFVHLQPIATGLTFPQIQCMTKLHSVQYMTYTAQSIAAIMTLIMGSCSGFTANL